MKICDLKRPEIMLLSAYKDGNFEQALIILCRHFSLLKTTPSILVPRKLFRLSHYDFIPSI